MQINLTITSEGQQTRLFRNLKRERRSFFFSSLLLSYKKDQPIKAVPPVSGNPAETTVTPCRKMINQTAASILMMLSSRPVDDIFLSSGH